MRHALDRYAESSADLADYLMLEQSLAAGCDRFVSFDQAMWEDERVSRP